MKTIYAETLAIRSMLLDMGFPDDGISVSVVNNRATVSWDAFGEPLALVAAGTVEDQQVFLQTYQKYRAQHDAGMLIGWKTIVLPSTEAYKHWYKVTDVLRDMSLPTVGPGLTN